MARINWAFYNVNTSTYVTSDVISFSRMRGRRSFLDQYSGQQMSVTIRNNTNQSASWLIGTPISATIFGGVDSQFFWVSEVQYNDEPGTSTLSGSGSGSTATILLDDWMTRAGRIQMTDFSFTQERCIKQLWNQVTVASGVLPADMDWLPTEIGSATATGGAYTGTLAQRININMATNAPGRQQYVYANQMCFYGSSSGSGITNAVTFQPSVGSSTGNQFIVYQDFKRITAGQNFINTVTATPPIVAPQTRTNPTSVTKYGTRFNGMTTQNYDITETANVAQWNANCQSDPYDLRYEITFTDTAQGNTGINSMLGNYFATSFAYLKYVVPGSGVTTTEQVSIEGISYSGTPEQTIFTVYCSPNDYYSQFILDSPTFGVLDQNRLGVTY
jgi:hypothetical protein